ncbi:hypothetical protein JW935_21585, partial [candidate division KSB1 bacterium]|nr:hypothetical protein [candidate division KSB1 bacterium]
MFNSRNIICFTFLVCGIFNVFASAFLSITTDKARYAPGEPVELSVQLEQINPGAKMEIYYSHLNE